MTALEGVRDEYERDSREGLPPGGRDPFAVNTERALDTLMRAWGDAYELGIDGHGRWVALRRDGKTGILAEGPDDLQVKIAMDYSSDPVASR